METLIIGQIDVLSQPFLDQLSRQTDLVLSADRPVSNFTGTKIKQYTHAVQDDSFLNLFSAYSFDAVLFFVGRPESQSNDSSEIEDLERALNACAQKPIKKVILVSSTYVYKKMESVSEEEFLASNGADIRLSAMEELCRTYRETYHVPVTISRTACLYGEGETASYVGDSIKKLVEEDEIVLDGRLDQVVGFLSLRDLATLIERILLELQKTIPVMNVPGYTRLSLQQFADLLKKKKLGVSIRFTGRALGAGPPVQLQKAFAEYRWEPEVDLLQEMDNLVDRISSSHSSTQRSFFDRAKDFYRTHSTILIGLELIVGFFLMEYMIDFSATTVQFRVIDFRLLFVVLFAAAHGPQLGLLSALIASISVYTSYMAMGVDWRIIFYNVDNWIPFAVYFITAWIIEYVHDRYQREVEDTQEEIATFPDSTNF
ncbi:NAD-dependent epimerase/dehydratase family protein [Atopococcus tabaci]|uniref:NAD-dependent epimerase/dehydratase family protein n=1 Tax=Atopococcus tabaci TaxID=269774 RepID=UPI0003FD60BA|nr:NAD-dependent epimerase/dehydratase family protein [Atopococcus tabaci]